MAHYIKNRKHRVCCSPAAACVISALSGILTVILLVTVLMGSGDTRAAAGKKGTDLAIMDQFDMAIGNAVSDSLEGVLSLQKTYWLPEDALKAPKPNPACAGETQDPSSLDWLIEDAKSRLGLEDMLFSTDVEIFPGSEVRYYLDDTIFSISWKVRVDYSVYSLSEVRIAHPSQFRRFLSGGEFGSGVLYTTSQMAQSVNAVTAVSGDYYAYRPCGITVHQGEVCRAMSGDFMDTCFVDDQGNLHFVRRTEMTSPQQVEQYVEDNNIRFSLAFGPILVVDGKPVHKGDYALGEVSRNFSRAAICQQGPLHYVTAMVNTAPRLTSLPTMETFARVLAEMGVRNAYGLDGGQTATMISNGEVFNNIDYGNERLISDILYFATAIPEAEAEEGEQ